MREFASIGVDFARDAFTGEAFSARNVVRMTARVTATSAQGLAAILPAAMNRAAMQEFANKLGAWELFAYADRLFAGSSSFTLREVVARVSQLDSYSRVWAMEGIGHYYAQSVLRENGVCRRLLRNAGVQNLPKYALLPLHTGAGLALAEAALQAACLPEIGPILDGFWQECLDNAKDSYAQAVFEALGLVAVTLYPHLVSDIDRHLSVSHDDLAAYFWHGAGRGLYFSPFALLPLAAARSRTIKVTQDLPPTREGRRNTLAGFSWALTLVNIRNPEVIEQLLADHADQIKNCDSFAVGVASALEIWHLVAPDDPHADILCRFQPEDPASVGLWDQVIRKSCADVRHFPGTPASDLFRVPPAAAAV